MTCKHHPRVYLIGCPSCERNAKRKILMTVFEEEYTKVKATKIETVGDLFKFLVDALHEDPRGMECAKATAVHIQNQYVGAELREFKDGTRELSLIGF